MNHKSARIAASDAQMDAAIARGRALDSISPRAVRAGYDRNQHKLSVTLSNGVIMLIPPKLLQGLQGAVPEQLEKVEIVGSGTGLHWPVLNVDHLVSGLIGGVYGTRNWMAAIGRKGGKIRSLAKRAASRRNGRRGGRPIYRAAFMR
jgi:Protein of unknown function (DUF2442)